MKLCRARLVPNNNSFIGGVHQRWDWYGRPLQLLQIYKVLLQVIGWFVLSIMVCAFYINQRGMQHSKYSFLYGSTIFNNLFYFIRK